MFKPKSRKNIKRYPSFFTSNGDPIKVRVYDNKESIDRYTIVFTGSYRNRNDGQFLSLGCSCNPNHPMGMGSRHESSHQIDSPSYSHLGTKISYDSLPLAVKVWVVHEYAYLWDFTNDVGEVL